ncbi:MAG: hypothetical protein ACLP0B_17010 [Steroidobacteraceae bacterium]
MAENQPPPAAASAQGQAPGSCTGARGDVFTASIVQATGESLQRKRWQPQGGVIQFTIRSFAAIPERASFFVCFRWKTTAPEDKGNYVQVRPDRLDRNNDGTTWTVTTTIPVNFPEPPPGRVVDTALPLVPLADIRIVALKEDKTLAADVATTIGITHPWLAIFYAVATIVIALVVLSIVADWRLKHPGIKNARWPLRIISTPSGYASLSQLQIVLWTLVVAASAVYVMALSGDLIEITNGTLVLLGIAGAAALGAKAHSESRNSKAQAEAATKQRDADQAKIEAATKAIEASATQAEKDTANRVMAETEDKAGAARARAKDLVDPPGKQTPRWSDLIVNEYTHVDGTVSREIDVARFQMLLFTLITAAFVLMNVVTTYVIPEIPTGFLTLMGISNGVYLGAKVAQGSG